jgi:hypothetical protein
MIYLIQTEHVTYHIQAKSHDLHENGTLTLHETEEGVLRDIYESGFWNFAGIVVNDSVVDIKLVQGAVNEV